MNEEIEAIKGTLDLLIARSLAQEALLIQLAQRDRELAFWFGGSFDRVTDHLQSELTKTQLTDLQAHLLREELRRLHRLLSTTPPADSLPF